MSYHLSRFRLLLAITPRCFAGAAFTPLIHHRLPMSLSGPGLPGRERFAEPTAGSHNAFPAGKAGAAYSDRHRSQLDSRKSLHHPHFVS